MAHDDLGRYLDEGWEISGYSVCMMAAGATTHHILLKKGTEVATYLYVNNGENEMGRRMDIIWPKQPAAPKRGFFG